MYYYTVFFSLYMLINQWFHICSSIVINLFFLISILSIDASISQVIVMIRNIKNSYKKSEYPKKGKNHIQSLF